MKDINEIQVAPVVEPSQETAEIIPFDEIQRRVRLLELKRQIASGEYQPNLSRLAGAMLRHEDFNIQA